MIRDLLTDIDCVLRYMPKDAAYRRCRTIEVLAEAIQRDRSFLELYPTCLFQSLWNSGYWYDSREAHDRYWTVAHGMDIWNMTFLFSESVSTLVEGWKGSPIHRERPWLRAISPPQHRLRSHLASEQKMPWRFSTQLALFARWRLVGVDGMQYSPEQELAVHLGPTEPTLLNGSLLRGRSSIWRFRTDGEDAGRRKCRSNCRSTTATT